MHNDCLLRLVQPMKVRHCRIECEERIERQCRRFAVEHEGTIAAQTDPVGIANRRNHAKPVESTTQDDNENAGIAAFGARQFGCVRPSEQGTGADQHLAPRGQMQECHDHLR